MVDALTFVAALIDSIAWPVLIGGVLSLFKRDLTGLLERLVELKWGDKSVTLAIQERRIAEHEVEELERQVQSDGKSDSPGLQEQLTQAKNRAEYYRDLEERLVLRTLTSDFYVPVGTSGLKLSRGRIDILKRLVKIFGGPGTVLELSPPELQARFDEVKQRGEIGALGPVNAGAFTGLHDAGLISQSNELTTIGAHALRDIAEEMSFRQD